MNFFKRWFDKKTESVDVGSEQKIEMAGNNILSKELNQGSEDMPIQAMERDQRENIEIIRSSLLFNEKWYKDHYGFGAYMDGAAHYLNKGWREGKNPSSLFQTKDYLENNSDIGDVNPLLHFEKFGYKEGRYRKEIIALRERLIGENPDCYSDMQDGLIRLRITDACNAKCRYCGLRLGLNKQNKDDMSPKWYYEYCLPLYEKVKLILITGGDALIAKESYNYMQFMSRNYPQITLMTESNGIAFADKFRKIACENLVKTHFSVNASNVEIFRQGCWEGEGAEKVFPRIISNINAYIELLKEKDLLCFASSISMVVNKDTASDVLNFIEMALKWQANAIYFYFDYTENDMDGNYFGEPKTSRNALKILMEVERLLAGRVSVYFRLWIPLKEANDLQREVEEMPVVELEQKYSHLLKLADGRSMRKEFELRNMWRRKRGKKELTFQEDFFPTLRTDYKCGEERCFAPWKEVDLYPNGRMDFCGWFEPTLDLNQFIENDAVDWEAILNSFEYMSARKRMLHNNFRGCMSCCPMNSSSHLVTLPHKYGYERKVYQKCACCGSDSIKFSPLPEEYLQQYIKHGVRYNAAEMLNVDAYSCPKCGAADRERLYALWMNKNFDQDSELKVLDIAPAKPLCSFIKNNFPKLEYKTADLFMNDVDYKVDVMHMPEIQDGSFDFFICSHVLEHVADDVQAMKELRRILSDNGQGILVVPIDLSIAEIDEDPELVDIEERWRRFGQGDHIRRYSKAGFLARLKQSGLAVQECGLAYFGEDKFAANSLTRTSVVYIVSKGA